jgi:hypothetical protein
MEVEPNNTVGTAHEIRLHEFGEGDINPVADVDLWWARNAAVGDLVFAYVDTQPSSTTTDSVLTVLANDGTTVIETDPVNSGPGNGSVVAGAIVPQAGVVFYRINEYGDDAQITPYDLFQAVVKPADTAAEWGPTTRPSPPTSSPPRSRLAMSS